MGFWQTRFSEVKGQGRGALLLASALGASMVGGVALAMIAVRAPAPATHVAAETIAKAPTKPQPKPVASVAPIPATAPVADAGYVVKGVLKVDGPMRQGDYYWDESGAPAAGPVVITVDLVAQTVSIFRGGYEIGTAVIIYGSDTTPTPLGIFPITQKDAKHVSNLYNAPMPYMLRLTNDGISLHGSEVGDGYVTHGCIGVPTAFAKKLFGAVKLGDKVIVTRGERLATGQAITAA